MDNFETFASHLDYMYRSGKIADNFETGESHLDYIVEALSLRTILRHLHHNWTI